MRAGLSIAALALLLTGCTKPDGLNPFCETEGRALTHNELIHAALPNLLGKYWATDSKEFQSLSVAQRNYAEWQISERLRPLIDSDQFMATYPDCCRLVDREVLWSGPWPKNEYLSYNWAYKGIIINFDADTDFGSKLQKIRFTSKFLINSCGTTSKIYG